MDLLLRNFDNVMTFIINKRIDDELKTEKTWRQFASHHTKSSEKKIRKNIYFTFQNLQGNRVNTGNQRDMPWCPYNPGVPWALRKNVKDKCCSDIKTKADKDEELRVETMTAANSKSQGSETCVTGGEKKNKKNKWLCIVQGSNMGRTDKLKITHITLFC